MSQPLTREQIVARLRECAPFLSAEYGVARLGLFGSFASGKATSQSDVDIVVEFERPIGLKFVELADYLESLLDRKVDVLTPEGSALFDSTTSQRRSVVTSNMSERTDFDWLSDIVQAIARIASYVHGMEFEDFSNDRKTQDAVIRNLEILSEASKNVSTEARSLNSELPWGDMARARDRLIHRYFGVNLDVVWRIASSELPELGPQIEAILGQMRQSQ